ncbi:DUF5789 family protein [Haloparvum sedimenti]|uniref:DUF5789 family protein n=1 Tax=Haloparvum sedimenti TaxID=1678448 RepID=UPI00071E72C7|nr:hypothetical protein [Haloparvum sedimenti]
MGETVKLSRVQDRLAELSYPVHRDDAAVELHEVTLTYADGQANLGKLVDKTNPDAFDDPNDLFDALQNVLPIEAVGEPGQSDGDA